MLVTSKFRIFLSISVCLCEPSYMICLNPYCC
eukprot:UN03692